MKHQLLISMLSLACISPAFANTPIVTPNAPAAIGPYSQGIMVGKQLYISGQVHINPKTGKLEEFDGDIKAQTALVLSNIQGVLEAAGCTKSDVAKTTVFLTNIDDFAKMNEVYAEFFEDTKPARSTFAVQSLPKGASIEIEAIAHCQ